MAQDISLTRREEELMDFLWECGEPVTSNDILDRCQPRTWSNSYLQVMLRALLNKGMLEPIGMVRYGTQYARKLRCTMTKEEYYVALAAGKDLDKGLFAKAAVAMAVKEKGEDRQELVEQLEEMLRDFSEEETDPGEEPKKRGKGRRAAK